MFTSYLTGFTLMATLIMPIGMQNAFVLNQGIKRQHHLLVASFCSLSDAFFMSIGVWGGATLLASTPWLLNSIGILGVIFMSYYGYTCFRAALNKQQLQLKSKHHNSLKTVLLACAAFTFFNPHVYIDTIVILGGFAANLQQSELPWFTIGGVTASIVWFFSLALLGQKLSPFLAKPRSQQIINFVIAIMMWVLAAYLIQFIFYQ